MSKGWKTAASWVLLIVVFLAVWQVLQPTPHAHSHGDSQGTSTLVTLLPLLFIGVLFFVFMRRLGQGGTNILSLRKTTARLVAKMPDTTFADVGGAAEAKQRLAEIVDYLKAPARWEKAGIRLPTGVLLEGPPGCGKTLLARALAGEAKVPFFEVSASEFVELFVGAGASRVRNLFEQAAKKAPAIVFIDELDAVGRKRGAGAMMLSHQEREQTLNQLLTSLDGFQKIKRVVVVAATNRGDVLDPALLRPGRFDVRLKLPAPSADARAEVLAVHTRNKPLEPGVDMVALAGRTDGLSGAELEHLTNEAATRALRRARERGLEKAAVTQADFEDALANRAPGERRFNRLDVALIESASQLSQPTGRIVVRATLENGDVTEGEIVWVDGTFMKLKTAGGATALISKQRVAKLEALGGTETATLEDVVEDRWAQHRPDAA